MHNFAIELADQFYRGKRQPIPKSWIEALTQLRYCIEEQNEKDKKIILFFDELPWLASRKSGFLPALEHFWNRHMSRLNNVILIVCGSATSWIINNIINNKGGLYGRLTSEIHLKPYDLEETERYLKTCNVKLERKQIAEVYMAIGGIPKYLSYISNGKSSAQIINDICFTPSAPLSIEFNKLFSSLFEYPTHHTKIVETLSKKRIGMTREELSFATSIKLGGTFVKTLKELEESGFIHFVPEFGKKKKGGRFRLTDEYSFFYLCWIREALNHHATELSESYWIRMQSDSRFMSWAGYTFEGLCLKHIKKIVKALELTVVAISASSWSYTPPKGSDDMGAQIDLVIDRADRCINLCEIKFSNDVITIDKEYAKKLEYKKNCFQRATGTKKTLFTTMITTYGVKENSHFFSIVDNQMMLEDLFTI